MILLRQTTVGEDLSCKPAEDFLSSQAACRTSNTNPSTSAPASLLAPNNVERTGLTKLSCIYSEGFERD